MTHAPDSIWWKNAVIYQIYPRSFADGSGDGVGDLRGIRAHLDHLVELGADAVWISPMFRSPMADAGYDISDYCDIVAGFRVDAASHMVEAAGESDPRDNDGSWLLEELRAHVTRRYPDAVLLGEADVEPEAYADYFGDGNRFSMVANFWLNNFLYKATCAASP